MRVFRERADCMNRITKITEGKGREKRLNIFLDDSFSFSLLAEVAVKEGLRVGQELSAARVDALTGADRYQRCFNAAVRYLGPRPRSETEIRRRLLQRGFDRESINKVIVSLREQGLADDNAFARYWKENREAFSPRSRQLTRLELRQKGLADEAIEPAVSEISDGDSAYRAALARARRISVPDYQTFRRRLGDYLRRRGFSYDVINTAVAKVWDQQGVGHGQLAANRPEPERRY